MSILDDATFTKHLKNFAVFLVLRSALADDTGRYDEQAKAVLSMTFERQYPLYLESMAYLAALSDRERGEIFAQAKSQEVHPAFQPVPAMEHALETGRANTTPPYPLSSGIPVQDVFALWQAEYEAATGEEDGKRRAGPREKPKDLFSVHSSAPVYDIGETIARGKFELPEDGRFPQARIIGGTEGRIEILPFWDHDTNQPLTPQSINLVAASDQTEFLHLQEEAIRIATSYNEEMATYFYAMDAYWLMNAKTPDDYVTLDIGDLLQYSGKKPVKTHGRYTGTYRPDQLQRAGLMVYGMGFSMVEIEKTIIKGVGERSHFKRLWDVTDMYMMKTLDNDHYIESMTYRPSEFMRHASFGSRRETALLMSKVLRLDYAKMVTARRLGRYFTWLWRDRAHSGNLAGPISCRRLLERAGVEVEKGNERYARRKLETALDRLETEGIIAQWVLLNRDNTPADLSQRISFPLWCEMKISVSPPDVILSFYAGNFAPPDEKPKPAGIDTEKLKAERRRRGYTLAMLSEETGVEISTLSRIEAGKTKRPRKEHLEAIKRWLGAPGEENEW
ncbi:helix-turn-helix domain-containing protein [Ruminococcaceae bacterium OttesenSCG-928-I18]|nr:helix-turn-helix domain-containing protein [Ruminococcaceae bacterium OttesenSCG-928-I18]